ncbi:Os08g0504800, partial [Oryza sativa Japonica Group]
AATHGHRPRPGARPARPRPRRHGHRLPRRGPVRRLPLRPQGVRQAVRRGDQARRRAPRAVGAVRALPPRAPAPPVPPRLRRDARPPRVGRPLLPRRRPQRAPLRAPRPRLLPGGDTLLRRRDRVRAVRAPRVGRGVPRPQARERAPPRRRPCHPHRLRPLPPPPSQDGGAVVRVAAAAHVPGRRPPPARLGEERDPSLQPCHQARPLAAGGEPVGEAAAPEPGPVHHEGRQERAVQEGQVGAGVAGEPEAGELRVVVGEVVLVRGHGGVRGAGDGEGRGPRARRRLVGRRRARLRDGVRADAVQGQEPEGDVPERAPQGRGVRRRQPPPAAGAHRPHLAAAGEGPQEEAGVPRRRRRGPSSPVLRRRGVGHARRGVPAALHPAAG